MHSQAWVQLERKTFSGRANKIVLQSFSLKAALNLQVGLQRLDQNEFSMAPARDRERVWIRSCMGETIKKQAPAQHILWSYLTVVHYTIQGDHVRISTDTGADLVSHASSSYNLQTLFRFAIPLLAVALLLPILVAATGAWHPSRLCTEVCHCSSCL